jgi:effector-binding domain-containing protein
MQPQLKQIPAVPVISHRDRLTIPQIPSHSGPAIQSLIETLNRLGVSPAGGAMIYIYHGCDGNPATEFDLEICLPVPTGLTARVELPIELKSTLPFQCIAADYVGPMSGIGRAWMELVQEIKSSGRQPTEQSREVYKKWVGFDSAENVTELQQGIV